MFRTSNLRALLVLGALLAPAFSLHAFASAPYRESESGCHDSLPAAPSPVPATHQCCAGGHRWAIPAQHSSYRIQLAHFRAHAGVLYLPTVPPALHDLRLTEDSASPPRDTCLRI
jgi:hypothetical protein